MPVTKPVTATLQVHFTSLADPRRRKITHPLLNFIVIAICAVICGADDFVAIADFGRRKRKWFRRILDLQNGIPSHDRFNAIFAMLSPAEFERCLLSWIQALHEVTGGQVIAIDGKTLRGSFDKASIKSAIRMISTWASANSISLGQVVADEKSNQGRLRDGIEEFFAEFLDGKDPSVGLPASSACWSLSYGAIALPVTLGEPLAESRAWMRRRPSLKTARGV